MNYTSSRDSDEKCEKRPSDSKNDIKEIMSGFCTEEIIEELFYSHLQRYHIVLEQLMKGSDFVFDYDEGFFYKYHKVSLVVDPT